MRVFSLFFLVFFNAFFTAVAKTVFKKKRQATYVTSPRNPDVNGLQKRPKKTKITKKVHIYSTPKPVGVL